MRRRSSRSRSAAFTLIEVMVVIALVAVVVSLAGPSFRDYILMQRLRSVQAQLVTDINYARSEAVSRGVTVQMRFQDASGQTCYIIYSRNDNGVASPCDCTAAAGSRCPSTSSEIKTVNAPGSESVAFYWEPVGDPLFLTLSARTGGPEAPAMSEGVPVPDFAVEARLADASRRFKVGVTTAGRVQVCSPSGSIAGIASC
jgi:type IV fimbrial biogenesis protein FimT